MKMFRRINQSCTWVIATLLLLSGVAGETAQHSRHLGR